MNIQPKVQRLWQGKGDMVDSFLQWAYDHVMTQTDQEKKDRTNRRYYRYYNDGDHPRGIRYVTGQTTAQTLEIKTTEVLLKLYRKYATPERRRQFYVWREENAFNATGATSTLAATCPGGGCQGYFVKEYVKNFGRRPNVPELDVADQLAEIEEKRAALHEAEKALAQTLQDHHYRIMH